jgi:hypothetical protein
LEQNFSFQETKNLGAEETELWRPQKKHERNNFLVIEKTKI